LIYATLRGMTQATWRSVEFGMLLVLQIGNGDEQQFEAMAGVDIFHRGRAGTVESARILGIRFQLEDHRFTAAPNFTSNEAGW
jgi:hypothetical protein